MTSDLVPQAMAVVGFFGLQAGEVQLDASCGLGDKYVLNAVPSLKQATGSERAKIVLACVFASFIVLCIALGEV